jgi:hypothetical protein
MDSRGASPRPATVGIMANNLLAARGSHPLTTVGKNWPSSFISRRPDLRFSRRYDYQRALNEDPKSIQQWFATVQSVLTRTVYNCYAEPAGYCEWRERRVVIPYCKQVISTI